MPTKTAIPSGGLSGDRLRSLPRRRALGVLVVFGLCGCASSTGVRTPLPPSWRQALPQRGEKAADIAGAYLVSGQLIGEKMAMYDRRPLEGIVDLFFDGDRRPPSGQVLELRRRDAGRLHVILKRDDRVLAETTVETTVEIETGAVVLRRVETRGGTNLPGGAVASRTIRLWRGRDDCLYAQLALHAAGLAVIVPYLEHGEAWGRWETATPAGVARLAAEQARRAARVRPRVGVRLPDFPDVLDQQGVPLTRASLEGRVVLLHVSVNQTQPYPLLDQLAAAYRRHQGRGLELITSWTNPPAQQDAVKRLIERHALPGRHLLEPDAGAGAPSVAGLLDLRGPALLVLDRDGRIVATHPPRIDLDAVLARLFPEGTIEGAK